jgi:CBS domain-containing protein
MREHTNSGEAPRSGEPQVQPLDVRTRTVLAGEGRGESQGSVFCPRRERSVPIDACATCEASAGTRAGAAGEALQVLCRFVQPDHEAPAPEVGRDDELATKLARPISEIMTTTVICVRSDMSAARVRSVLLERGIGCVPVVDAAGRPVGVVTKTDLMLAEGLALPESSVGAIMTGLALAVHEGMTIAQASALMAYEGVHRLPVVDDDHQVVGILSSLDVLHWIGQRSGYLMRPAGPGADEGAPPPTLPLVATPLHGLDEPEPKRFGKISCPNR